jgi:hypothetical protein
VVWRSATFPRTTPLLTASESAPHLHHGFLPNPHLRTTRMGILAFREADLAPPSPLTFREPSILDSCSLFLLLKKFSLGRVLGLLEKTVAAAHSQNIIQVFLVLLFYPVHNALEMENIFCGEKVLRPFPKTCIKLHRTFFLIRIRNVLLRRFNAPGNA